MVQVAHLIFNQWWNKECKDLQVLMVAMENKQIHGMVQQAEDLAKRKEVEVNKEVNNLVEANNSVGVKVDKEELQFPMKIGKLGNNQKKVINKWLFLRKNTNNLKSGNMEKVMEVVNRPNQVHVKI